MSIRISHVTKSYGEQVAVRDLSLDVPAGNVVAFLGPNGAGKTTTLKMTTGLLLPDSGRIEVCGFLMGADGQQAKAQLAYVPDQPFLYEKLAGREFLEFVGDMYCMARATARRRSDELIERLDMAGYIDQLAEAYSHGMKQRVVLAAAMLHDPMVLIVDEPMVGLDPRTVRLVKDLLRAKAAAGQTIFMSTHLLSIAQEIADRVGIVDEGRLRFLGTIDELREQVAAHDASLEHLYLRFTAGANGQPPAGKPEIGDSPATASNEDAAS